MGGKTVSSLVPHFFSWRGCLGGLCGLGEGARPAPFHITRYHTMGMAFAQQWIAHFFRSKTHQETRIKTGPSKSTRDEGDAAATIPHYFWELRCYQPLAEGILSPSSRFSAPCRLPSAHAHAGALPEQHKNKKLASKGRVSGGDSKKSENGIDQNIETSWTTGTQGKGGRKR